MGTKPPRPSDPQNPRTSTSGDGEPSRRTASQPGKQSDLLPISSSRSSARPDSASSENTSKAHRSNPLRPRSSKVSPLPTTGELANPPNATQPAHLSPPAGFSAPGGPRSRGGPHEDDNPGRPSSSGTPQSSSHNQHRLRGTVPEPAETSTSAPSAKGRTNTSDSFDSANIDTAKGKTSGCGLSSELEHRHHDALATLSDSDPPLLRSDTPKSVRADAALAQGIIIPDSMNLSSSQDPATPLLTPSHSPAHYLAPALRAIRKTRFGNTSFRLLPSMNSSGFGSQHFGGGSTHSTASTSRSPKHSSPSVRPAGSRMILASRRVGDVQGGGQSPKALTPGADSNISVSQAWSLDASGSDNYIPIRYKDLKDDIIMDFPECFHSEETLGQFQELFNISGQIKPRSSAYNEQDTRKFQEKFEMVLDKGDFDEMKLERLAEMNLSSSGYGGLFGSGLRIRPGEHPTSMIFDSGTEGGHSSRGRNTCSSKAVQKEEHSSRSSTEGDPVSVKKTEEEHTCPVAVQREVQCSR
eukprot:gene31471-6659_t